MRVEQLHFFVFGALLAALAWAVTRNISSWPIRLHLRAIFLALGLGFIVIPGHGEFIAAPILAMFTPPLRSQLLALGGIYFLIWWAAALAVLKILHTRTTSHY